MNRVSASILPGMKRLAPAALAVVALVVVAAACTPAGRPPPNPPPGGGPPPGASTGDQNGPLNGCPVFPADNPWNTDISNTTTYPVLSNSSQIVSQVLADDSNQNLHADFGGGGAYGIPYVTVPGTQPSVPINYTEFGSESDPGPFPIPLGAPVEGGSSSTGDRHVIAIDRDHCRLYELYHGYPQQSSWNAGSGATWDLTSDAVRPAGWTSADAAGLPIFLGLARYDDVTSGAINHALRFTVHTTYRGYVYPARHCASSNTNPNEPAMGMRFRLKASYSLAGFHGEALVVLQALKKYGMIVADNGTSWYITGAADARWDDTDLDQLKSVPGNQFDVVNTGAVTAC